MATMKQGLNEITVEGFLHEKIVRDFDDGTVAGELRIEVPMSVDGKETSSIIPVNFYARPLTKAGKKNVAYDSVKAVLDKGVSLAEADGDYSKVTKLRVRNAQFNENIFIANDGRLVSYPRVRGAFFDVVAPNSFNPIANFKVKMVVLSIDDEEVVEDGEVFSSGRLVITGGLVQYNGALDEVKFVAENQKHVDVIRKNWEEGDTVNAQGILRFITKEVVISTDDDGDSFGEPVVETQTRRTNDLIIIGGSSGPVDGYEEEDVREARRERKQRIDDLQKKESADSGW